MAIIAKAGAEFEKPPTGLQQAVCSGVFDIGTHESNYLGKLRRNHQIIVMFELMEKQTQGDYAGNPFRIYKFYNLTLDEKSNLRKDLESWRNKRFTEEEAEGFDVEKLIGANCYLNIMVDAGKVKVTSIAALPPAVPKIQALDGTEPEWIGEKRKESLEAKGGVPSGTSTPPHTEDDSLPF